MLYVSDLDGTLLDRDGNLSEVSRSRLQELLNDGMLFTVASARSHVSIRERLGDLPLSLPIIEFNGAFLTDYQTGEKIHIHAIETQVAQGIHESFEQQQAVYFVSTYDGASDHVYCGPRRNKGMDYYVQDRKDAKDPRLCEISGWNSIFDEQIVCITAVGRQSVLQDYQTELAEAYGEQLTAHLWEDTYCLGWYWLMVHDGKACKGKALKQLCQSDELSRVELTVFGDQVNDLGMLEQADRSIAVSNACLDVLGRADLKIGNHNADAVTEFLVKDWQTQSRMVE